MASPASLGDPGDSGDLARERDAGTREYDLRFVTAEGTGAELTQNLCELATFTVTD